MTAFHVFFEPNSGENSTMTRNATRPAVKNAVRSCNGPGRKATRTKDATLPLTTSRPELLLEGRDRKFRHLVHGLFGFAAYHERIRNGHARVIGLAGNETVLTAAAHPSRDGDVNVKTVADHL